MNRVLFGAVGLAVALGSASVASATTFFPGSPNFTVFGDITSGPVTAFIGNSGIHSGAFTDDFLFHIDQNGTGSGSLSTSTTQAFSFTDLDVSSVTVNGMAATKTLSSDGLSEFFSISNVPIFFGALNTIEVTGLSRGNGSYGGNATFLPGAVPEVATWLMMLFGFGAVGAAVRYQRRSVGLTFS